jgi:hypothetical protein
MVIKSRKLRWVGHGGERDKKYIDLQENTIKLYLKAVQRDGVGWIQLAGTGSSG